MLKKIKKFLLGLKPLTISIDNDIKLFYFRISFNEWSDNSEIYSIDMKYLFYLDIDITDNNYTKEYCDKKIREAYEKYLIRRERELEIDKGEIVL